MTQTPVSNLQASLTLTEFVDINGVFPPRDGGGSGPFIGSIGIFAGEPFLFDAPADGQLYPINENTALFSILGTDFGGNGTTNFELPNLGGVEMIGAGNGEGLPPVVLGETPGEISYDLTKAQLPPSLGGTSAPVDKYQPSLAVNYAINIEGIFPGDTLTLNSLGVVSAFLGNFAPGGELLCDGQLLPISQYDALFNLLGTTYGGDGVTTFALPNLQGRDIVGSGSGFVLGEQVGTANVNLTNANSPLGSDTPIDNQQPGLVLNYYIALQGIFPSEDQGGNSSQQTPFLGQIVASAENVPDPEGWALCDGQLLPINQNQALFSVLGTTYGGNGTTNFALPNLEGQTVLGTGGADGLGTLGQVSGANTITLTSANVTVPTPTLTVSSDDSATSGRQIGLSNLVTITDPGSVGYEQLQLWDSGGAGGTFQIDGAAQPDNQAINVSPANVGGGVFDASTQGGTDALWARLEQNNGAFTGWEEFTVTVPSPTLAVTSIASATKGQTINLPSLVTISDPGDVGYQTLQLWDSDGTVAGGEFLINGVAQTANHTINVPSGANVVFDAGTSAGADTLWAQLVKDNGTMSGWEQFAVRVPTPTLSVNSVTSATKGQAIALSSLVTISDPGSVGYQTLQLWDSDGTVAGGEFLINGVAQTANHTINVPSGANVVFDAGTSAGTDTLWAQLVQDDGTMSGWEQFSVTVPTPTLTVQSDANARPSEQIPLSTLVTISDPGNVGYQTLQLWDSDGTTAGGEFLINGVAQTGNHAINVPSGANVVFQSGSSGDTDTLWAQLVKDNGTATGWQEFTVTDPVDVAPGATVELPSAFVGPVTFAGSTGTLQLDDSAGFAGTVTGMCGQDTLDLRDINFATIGTPTFAGNSSGGTLTVTDGAHTANIALLGNYLASTFVASSDGHGGASIADPVLTAATSPSTLTLPHGHAAC